MIISLSPLYIANQPGNVTLRIRRIYSPESEFLEKSKEYMAYLVNRGHVPEKVKSSFTEMGKITRSKAIRKKELTVSKKIIIFPAEYNPRGSSVMGIYYAIMKF